MSGVKQANRWKSYVFPSLGEGQNLGKADNAKKVRQKCESSLFKNCSKIVNAQFAPWQLQSICNSPLCRNPYVVLWYANLQRQNMASSTWPPESIAEILKLLILKQTLQFVCFHVSLSAAARCRRYRPRPPVRSSTYMLLHEWCTKSIIFVLGGNL